MTVHGIVQRIKGKVLAGSGSIFQIGGTGQKGLGPQQVGMVGGGTIFTQATQVGNPASASEQTLASTTLNANAFDTAVNWEIGSARILWMYAAGSVANNADTKTVKMYFGSSIVLSVAPTASAATPWSLELVVIKSGSSTQWAQGQPINGSTHGGVVNFSGTENDQAAITLKVTGQPSAANANDILLNFWQVAFYN